VISPISTSPALRSHSHPDLDQVVVTEGAHVPAYGLPAAPTVPGPRVLVPGAPALAALGPRVGAYGAIYGSSAERANEPLKGGVVVREGAFGLSCCTYGKELMDDAHGYFAEAAPGFDYCPNCGMDQLIVKTREAIVWAPI
jgi:hypothetical protein